VRTSEGKLYRGIMQYCYTGQRDMGEALSGKKIWEKRRYPKKLIYPLFLFKIRYTFPVFHPEGQSQR